MTTPGIISAGHWRFGAATVLHLLAWLLFFETGSRGPVELPLGIVSFCIAFVIVATLAWQWKCLGDPHELHNFIVHLLLLGSLFFLIVRLQAPVQPSTTVLSAIAGTIRWFGSVIGGLAQPLFDTLSSPVTALFFLAICLTLSLRRHFAVGLFVTLAAGAVALALARRDFGTLPAFLGGVACVSVAVRLQYHDAAERDFWRQVFARMDGDRMIRGDLELKYRLLQRLRREGRPLSEHECMATIERALDRPEHDAMVQETAVRVLRQMVRADALVQLQDSSVGRSITLNPELLATPGDAFTMIAVVPRTVCVLLVAVLWVLSPIDLVPDGIPGIGLLDDMVVTLLSGAVMSNFFAALRTWKRRPAMGTKSYLNEV